MMYTADVGVEVGLKMTKGMKSLVSTLTSPSSVASRLTPFQHHSFQLCRSKLGNEHWYLRTSVKRFARGVVLEHYHELSPNNDTLVKWSCDNLVPGSTVNDEKGRERLLAAYRKAKIADLTGVGPDRRAKFVYDRYHLVSAVSLLYVPVC